MKFWLDVWNCIVKYYLQLYCKSLMKSMFLIEKMNLFLHGQTEFVSICRVFSKDYVPV